MLEKVARRIDRVTDRQEQSTLSATTAILAGLVLDKMIITRLLREDVMKESVIYQEIEAASEAKGLEKGIQTGEASLVLR